MCLECSTATISLAMRRLEGSSPRAHLVRVIVRVRVRVSVRVRIRVRVRVKVRARVNGLELRSTLTLALSRILSRAHSARPAVAEAACSGSAVRSA